MKTIVVNITTEDKDQRDNSTTVAIVEVDRGAGWVRLDSKDIVTNKDKDVEFVLKQGERLVLEAFAPETAAYSRDQAAAYTPSTQVSDSEIDDSKKGEQNAEEKKKREAEYAAKAGRVGTQNFQKPPSQGTHPTQERDQHTGGTKVSPQDQKSSPATQQAPKPGPATAANPLKSSKDMK
jgi:hypothetical protein